MKKTIYIISSIVLILAVALLLEYARSGTHKRTESASFKDASYEIDGKWVALGTEGTTYFGNEATGDLNGDDKKDVAFLFTSNPGGSGTFYYVAAALSTDRGYVGTNAILLGDRIAPQNTSIEDGDVIVNYADRKSGEPMSTRPSQGITSYFKIVGDKLVLQGSR